MSLVQLFTAAVDQAVRLPHELRENASSVSALEEHRFDESYIEFLDTQIRLNARGNDWTDRLKQRRKALAPFLNLMLIRGKVNAGGKMFTVEIDPRGPRVVYWEQYEEDESEQQLPSG